MIDETIRSKLYDQLDRQYPMRPSGKPKRAHSAMGSREEPVDFSVQWQSEVLACKQQLLAEILFQLHTLFEFSVDDAEVKRLAREALESNFALDETCRTKGECDVSSYASCLFRREWYEASLRLPFTEAPGRTDAGHGMFHFSEASLPAALLSSLQHLERAGFFQKSRQDITGWTKRFLLIERYHRLDAIEHEARLDRYRQLHSHIIQGEPLRNPEDLSIWLEFRMLEESGLSDGGAGMLSHQLAQELDGHVSPELLAEESLLAPSLYVLLRCHQYCLAETLTESEQGRIEKLFATRRLDSLLDLMRVVLNKTMGERTIPEAGAVLDRLQAEGFNIEHQGFRDPYEADLVSLDEVERFERTPLPLFFDLESLTGRIENDLAFSRQILTDWHNRIIRDIVSECAAYSQAVVQPLPRNRYIARLVRFATGWTMAALPWLPQKQPEKLHETVLGTLPDQCLRLLVRPRKGYELKSRNELKQWIDREIQSQWDALQRIAQSRRIQGYHDYTQFTRYIVFQYLRNECSNNPASQLKESASAVCERARPDWVADTGKKWGLSIQQVHPHAIESVEDYCRAVIPSEHILPQLQRAFETTENDLQEVYGSMVSEFYPAFYTLLVGYGRHREDLSRIAASADHIGPMIRVLAPPLDALQAVTLDSLKKDLARRGASLYRAALRPCLLNAAEWKAYLAWEAHRRLGGNIPSFLDHGDLDVFLAELENCAAQVDLPPHTLTHQSVQATLLSLLKPEETTSAIPEDALQKIVQLLPQLDCAACGQVGCREFARSLLTDRAQPQHCVHLQKHAVSHLVGLLRQFKETADNAGESANWLEILSDPNKWQSSAEKELFRKVFSSETQKARHLLMARLKELWRNFPTKPQIFKNPSMMEFHESLRAFMGPEAVERLHDDERAHLIEHGEERLKAEWQALKDRQNWLNLLNRKRQSRPLLQRKDPSWVAADFYKNTFFLHQLCAKDRQLVLQHRYERYQDGFSYWWNEDLLSMNLPDFFIRDWEDFSKIIKNAYWHQESSLSAGQALATLKNEALLEESSSHIGEALLTYWLDSESLAMERMHAGLTQLRDQPEDHLIGTLAQLRELIPALVDESKLAEASTEELTVALFSLPISTEEQFLLAGDRIWKRFQEENFRFSVDFCCLWEQLSAEEKNSLRGLPGADDGNGSGVNTGGGSAWYLKNWQEPLHKRVALIRAVIVTAIKDRYREELECRWFDRLLGDSSARAKEDAQLQPAAADHAGEDRRPEIPSAYFRLLIRRGLREGRHKEQLAAEIRELLRVHPYLRERLIEDALYRIILTCQHQSLSKASRLPLLSRSAPGDVMHPSKDPHEAPREADEKQTRSKEKAALVKMLPELKSVIDLLLERHRTMDRERLLHYLFLLAKMEGNLDSLTALMREIRETSDIMEAAWLRFTQERILEGPGPKGLPGTSLGITLLASRVKDKDAINRGLRDGVSRKEKRAIAAAVNELTNFIRFHVLLNEEHNGNLQGLVADFKNAGYDLAGIHEPALELAIQRQWERREQLKDNKIWIYTTVTARRLAAQDQELQEVEREFYGIRSDILKDDVSSNERCHEIASRRGVALGRIKEEMYRQLSDLLEKERIATFQRRIEQIVDQLDNKREEIYRSWSNGSINRRSVFYTLRQYQKREADPSFDDFRCFLRDHWFAPLEELRSSQRPDRDARIKELDNRLRALLRISLLEWEAQAEQMAERDLDNWVSEQMVTLESRLG